ncbi:ABC transporter ATP-binding protein [Occultella kanbiaonis]|uniref:ABC transporter ATP-binding protein n=1 Tax=Occultella kanbiaonis TaxID=2675754 RepID=UPI00143D1CA6|nr:ATP-binding cassette domain-containing protein [Occultella kanbiaonis]
MIGVEDLTVQLDHRTVVGPISFTAGPGEVIALVGESGSGKTTTGLAVMGEFPSGARVAGVVRSDPRRIGYVPQHPGAVLTPSRRVGSLLREVARVRGRAGTESVARAVARAHLDPALLRRFPHQLSGGQQQRAVFALALIGDPDCLVVDEPTTGQDPGHRDALAAELESLREEGTAIILLSHDLALVRRLADDTLVLRRGAVVEHGRDLWAHPREPYTRQLIEAGIGEPPAGRTASAPTSSPVLRVDRLTAGYGRRGDPVLDEVELRLERGSTLTVRGPSGAGKSTLARCLAGLHQPHGGELRLAGRVTPWAVRARTGADRALVQYVFQDARAAFDPFRPIGAQVIRPVVNLRGDGRAEVAAALADVAGQVGLEPDHLARRVSQLSGGELQRAALARALLARPDVLICDEITTGLDAVTREAVLDLLERMVDGGMALVIITHEDRVARRFADRVLSLEPPGPAYAAAQTPSSLPLGSVKWNRRPPGNS